MLTVVNPLFKFSLMVTYLGAKSSKNAAMMGEGVVWSVDENADEISIDVMKPVRTYGGPSIE